MKFSQRWHEFFDRKVPNAILRILVMFAGLAFVALGVALSRATGLGTSVVSAVPAVLSYATPITMGVFTFILNILFVLAQVIMLRKDFKPLQFLCVPFVFMFAVCIDVFVPLCELIPMPNYAADLAFIVLASTCTALGVWLQVRAALILLPGDGIVLTISRVFNKDFGKTKMVFDISNVACGVILALATMGYLEGVREGTIIMAFLVGPQIRLLSKVFSNIDYYLPIADHFVLTADKGEKDETAKENTAAAR